MVAGSHEQYDTLHMIECTLMSALSVLGQGLKASSHALHDMA